MRRVFPLPAARGGGACISGAALALLLLTSCAPDLGPLPELQDPAKLAATDASARADQRDGLSDRTGEAWWKAYGDPELDALVDEALRDSPDLKIAAARVHAARAEAGEAESALAPSVTAVGAGQEAKISRDLMGETFSSAMPKGWHNAAALMGSVQYELDFFGKNRAAFAAATSAAEATAADEAAARLHLSAAVATAYVTLTQLSVDRRLAAEAVRQREDSARLVERRFQQNLENQGTLALARAEVWAARADVETVDRQIALARNQLAALLGKGPERGARIVPPEKTARPAELPAELPLALIARRPDIRAARKRAEAAAANIKAAKANFYPNVNLVGLFGSVSLDAKDLLTKPSVLGAAGPVVTLPLFDYGLREGIYRKSRAEYDAAVALYDATLTGALREAADAYAGRRRTEAERANAREALAAGAEACRVLRIRYEAGLAPYTDVLTAETRLIARRRQVADLQAQSVVLDVALMRALGGGYAEEHTEP